MIKKGLQILIFLGIGTGIMTLVFRSQNAAFQEQCRLDGTPADQCSLTEKLLHDFSTVHLGWMALVMLAFTVSNLFRALRWQMLLQPMGYKPRLSTSFLTILLGYFANLGFPRIGEVVRAGALAKSDDIPVEKVMGTLVIDRLMDFVCLGLVVALAFVFEGDTILQFIQQNKTSGAQGGGLLQSVWFKAVIIIGLIALALAWILREKIHKMEFFQKILGFANGFIDGFKSIFQLRQPILFIAYSLGIWLMFYLQCYFNMLAFSPTAHLGASAALMVFVFGTLGFIIPSPGGMGTFHALAIAGLALYGVSGTDGFSYANIAFFAVQIFYNIVAGVIALVLLPSLRKKT